MVIKNIALHAGQFRSKLYCEMFYCMVYNAVQCILDILFSVPCFSTFSHTFRCTFASSPASRVSLHLIEIQWVSLLNAHKLPPGALTSIDFLRPGTDAKVGIKKTGVFNKLDLAGNWLEKVKFNLCQAFVGEKQYIL